MEIFNINKSHKSLLYLDLDGVIVAFVSGALKALGITEYSIPTGEHSIEKWNGVNVTTAQFWQAIDKTGKTFWRELEKFDYSDELVKYLHKNYDLYILTSPSRNPECLSGKMEWIQKHYPFLQRRVIFTPNKYLLAAPDRILIDDTEDKIDKFSEWGGKTILFPQEYNRAWEEYVKSGLNKLQYVIDKLEELKNE